MSKREENIKKIIELSGLSEKIVKEKLKEANNLGLGSSSFLKYQCWNMTAEEIKTLVVELKAERQARREKTIENLSKKANVDKETAAKMLDDAKEKGIKPKTYINEGLYKLNEADLAVYLETGVKTTDSTNIETVAKATGWSEEEVVAKMNAAKKKGLSYDKYVRFNCFELSESEIDELIVAREAIRAQNRKNREFYAAEVCKKTGWNTIKAVAEMTKAKEMGISFVKYIQKACFSKTEEEIATIAKFLKRDKIRIRNNKKMYVEKVMAETGWTYGKAELEILKAKANCEASYEDYFVFKMYELTPEEQKNYVTFGKFSKMRIKFNEHDPGRYYFDNKAIFNETFKECINRRWFVNKDLSYEEFLTKIDGIHAVLAKPLAATQGIGIAKFDCTVEDKKKLYDEIMALPESIVEQYIVQHADVMEFCDTSVNTLRITTLNYNGKCNYLYAVFRMGRGHVVDNFHAGGIAASVDVNTGIVTTNAVDLDGNVYEVNPYSGKKILGFQIPNWDKIVEVCEKSYNKLDTVNLIGWDFAITPDGVDLIEGNPGASYVVAQIPNVPNRVGLMKDMVEPYL